MGWKKVGRNVVSKETTARQQIHTLRKESETERKRGKGRRKKLPPPELTKFAPLQPHSD